MRNNKLIISAAGSGKTTCLVNEALKKSNHETVLITTYTEANEAEIRKKILSKRKSIPTNIIIQTWFSFLLQHGVRPYQGTANDILWDQDIKGMYLSSGKSGAKYNDRGQVLIFNGHPLYWKKEDDFKKHYFTNRWSIYSDKISKFIVENNKAINNSIVNRISEIYSNIFIDEVQDLAGYDLELVKLLFKSSSNILMVGDPRQTTYLTHHSTKYSSYKEGRIKQFLIDKCKSLLADDSIDEETLKKSHRNNKEICEYSSKLYTGEYEKSEPCSCESCRNNKVRHAGVFILKPQDVDSYLKTYHPVQLRWNKSQNVNANYPVFNFGESKGQTHDRVLIYPTYPMIQWIKDNTYKFSRIKKGKVVKIVGAKERFYVAITRAKHSVAIVYNFKANEKIEGAQRLKLTNGSFEIIPDNC